MPGTSVRIDTTTRRELKKLSASLGVSVGDVVALAVRRLRQERMDAELAIELTPEEEL